MRKVAVVVQDGAEPFGLGSLVEVWGEPYHPEDDNPVFDFRICTPRPGTITGRSDFDIVVKRDLSATEDADLLRDTVAAFSQEQIAPRAEEIDRTNVFPRDLWPQLGALGAYEVVTPNLYDLGGSSIDEWAEKLLDQNEGDLAVVGASIGG